MMSFRTLVGAAAILVVAASTVATAAPAGAGLQAGITITHGQTVTKTYPPIRLNSAGEGVDPDDCKTLPFCDTVPLQVVVPDDTPADSEFVVRVTLSWRQTAGPAGTASNDLDMYLWDDPKGKARVTRSASSGNPEIASLVAPRKGKYQIVIDNFAGLNEGYTLKVEYIPGDIVTPDESLDPSFRPPDAEKEGFAAPIDSSGGDDSPPPADSGSSSTGSSGGSSGGGLGEEAGEGGSTIGATDGVASIPLPGSTSDSFIAGLPTVGDNPLATMGEDSTLFRPALGRPVGPAGPVPAAVLIFWLAVAPAVLLGAGAVAVMRRRPVALTIG